MVSRCAARRSKRLDVLRGLRGDLGGLLVELGVDLLGSLVDDELANGLADVGDRGRRSFLPIITCHVVQCTAIVSRTMYDNSVHDTKTDQLEPTHGRAQISTTRRHHRHRSRQAVRRAVGAAQPRPACRTGHRPRALGPQRRRQDDGHPHPHHAEPADRGQRDGGRVRRGAPVQSGARPNRRRLPAVHRRRLDVGPAQPADHRPPARHVEGGCHVSAATSCSSNSISPTSRRRW